MPGARSSQGMMWATPEPTATPDPGSTVTQTAEQWVSDSFDVMVAEVAAVLMESEPVAELLGDIPDLLKGSAQTALEEVVGQGLQNAVVEFSDPRKVGDGRYALTVTVMTRLEADLPPVGELAFDVAVPFILTVDVDARAVEWEIDGASVLVTPAQAVMDALEQR